MAAYDYIHDGTAIYERSFAIIRAEADLSRFSEAEADVAIRMIHACGQVEAARHFVFSSDFVAAARAALVGRRADLLRCRDGLAWRHPRPAAGRQRGDLHAARPAHRRNRQGDRQHPLGRRHRSVGRAHGRLRRRHRQCADRALLSAGEAARRRAETRGHHRHAGRLRRRRRIRRTRWPKIPMACLTPSCAAGSAAAP